MDPEHVQRNRSCLEQILGRIRRIREAGVAGRFSVGASGTSLKKTSIILPDVSGLDVIELGCGTAYVSAWLARGGARVTGVDISEEQLKTARTLQAETSPTLSADSRKRRGGPAPRRFL